MILVTTIYTFKEITIIFEYGNLLINQSGFEGQSTSVGKLDC